MTADYDTEADAIAINLGWPREGDDPVHGHPVHERCNVATAGDVPVDVEILYPSLGVDEPLRAAAAQFDLDFEALKAAARSALAAPDRLVTLDVAARG